jgi:membrane protein DedA with SNARE-associated domain
MLTSPSPRWGLRDQILGALFLTMTSILLLNLIGETLGGWNPFAVPVRDNLLIILVISPAVFCLFLVGYFINKKIFWPWMVLAGMLIAIRLHS